MGSFLSLWASTAAMPARISTMVIQLEMLKDLNSFCIRSFHCRRQFSFAVLGFFLIDGLALGIGGVEQFFRRVEGQGFQPRRRSP